MKPDSPLFVLGSGDPEMRMIKDLLVATRCAWTYALSGAARVSPLEANSADPVMVPDWVSRVVYVECRAPTVDGVGRAVPVERVICDHHQPGDPGYGMGAEDFHRGSSLGQVLSYLGDIGRLARLEAKRARPARAVLPAGARPGLVWTGRRWVLCGRDEQFGELRVLSVDADSVREMVYVAAADHCLRAAYANRCRGVNPRELERRRLEAIAGNPYARVQRSVQELRRMMGFAEGFLRRYGSRSRPVDLREGVVICDEHGARIAPKAPGQARRGHCPECGRRGMWRESLPMLNEASARAGIGYLVQYRGREFATGFPEEQMEDVSRKARSRGLAIYGDPARGFLGMGHERRVGSFAG